MSWQDTQWSKDNNGPLSGLKVLDISRLVAGNMTSLQLADFGAAVTKVEPLPSGDPLRAWRQQGVSTFWKAYARNKQSLALDFRAEGATAVLEKLIASTDIVIENFRPGTFEKMGFDPNDLLKRYPDLIILRVSGFGQVGPYAKRPGFGTLIEGMSGFAARNGPAGGEPLLPPLALADMITGLYGANAVSMALHARNAGRGGQVIDLSLLDAMTSVLGPEALDFSLSGKPKPRVGNGSNTSSPRNAYVTSDGHWIVVSGSMQSMAERLFRAIGREDMITDPRFAKNENRVANRSEVDEIVGQWFACRSRDEVMDIMTEAGVTVAPLYDISDITDDVHFVERGIYTQVPDEELGQAAIHAPVPRLSKTPAGLRSAAPALGQHTDAVLADAGFEAEAIDGLRAKGVVA
jgi:crotonobetainyl-CoA:carnitine CoA-transferase CaiB-like acyl-CoA transferase